MAQVNATPQQIDPCPQCGREVVRATPTSGSGDRVVARLVPCGHSALASLTGDPTSGHLRWTAV